jgi:hypothetical protein
MRRGIAIPGLKGFGLGRRRWGLSRSKRTTDSTVVQGKLARLLWTERVGFVVKFFGNLLLVTNVA